MMPRRNNLHAEIDDWRIVIVSDPKQPMPRDAQILRLIDSERRIEYILGQTIVIVGRLSTANIPIDWPELSRVHCRLEWRIDRWFVKDLDSVNGFYINGTRYKECELFPGDRLTLADRTLDVDQIAVEELV